jgi:hypothetical protein
VDCILRTVIIFVKICTLHGDFFRVKLGLR